jgi:hypothetical protein
LAADASSTYSMEHTATTKQPSSYNFFPAAHAYQWKHNT